MKSQFPNFNLYDFNEQRDKALDGDKNNTILICHTLNHLLTVTNINRNTYGMWLVLDSLNSPGYLDYLKVIFRKLANNKKNI